MNFLHVNESSDIFISDFTLYFDYLSKIFDTGMKL